MLAIFSLTGPFLPYNWLEGILGHYLMQVLERR
jgi:hypothetical protein